MVMSDPSRKPPARTALTLRIATAMTTGGVEVALLQEVSDDVQVLEHESLSDHRPVMATWRAP